MARASRAVDWGRADADASTRRRGVPIVRGRRPRSSPSTPGMRATLNCRRGLLSRRRSRCAPGERALLALVATHEQPIPIPARDEVERRLDDTAQVWRRWLDNWEYDGPWAEHVARSALALKLMSYEPHGAIVAAPTTSLPERIGGDKNYDYRYMWVRDTAFTIDALMRLGLPEQVHESFCCLLRAVRTTAPDLRPFYSVEGPAGAPLRRAAALDGYRGSQPVRYGNAASSQLQLGSWGDLLETADLYLEGGNALDEATARAARATASTGSRSSGRTTTRASGSSTNATATRRRTSHRGWRSTARVELVEAGTDADRARRPLAGGARCARALTSRSACWSEELGTLRRVRRRREARRRRFCAAAAMGWDARRAGTASARRSTSSASGSTPAAACSGGERGNIGRGGRVRRLLVLARRGARAPRATSTTRRRSSSRSSPTRTTSACSPRRSIRRRRAARQLPAGAEPPRSDQCCRRDPACACRRCIGDGRCGSTLNAVVDEREMRERLREVAELALRRRVVLLGEQPEVVRERRSGARTAHAHRRAGRAARSSRRARTSTGGRRPRLWEARRRRLGVR